MASSKVDAALDRVDRILAERRGKSDPPSEFNDPNEITSRTQVEEIARAAADAAIKRQPSSPEIHNHFTVAQSPKAESDPPATSGIALSWKKGVSFGKLPAAARVAIVLVLGIVAIVAATAGYVLTH